VMVNRISQKVDFYVLVIKACITAIVVSCPLLSQSLEDTYGGVVLA